MKACLLASGSRQYCLWEHSCSPASEAGNMINLFIFILGVLVMLLTIAGVVLVGIHEASDPAHSRPEDLSNLEKRLVDRPDLSGK